MKFVLHVVREVLLIVMMASVACGVPLAKSEAKVKTTKTTYQGMPRTITAKLNGDGKTATVSISDEAKKEIATLRVEVEKGATDAVLAACKVKDMADHGKTIAACMATAGSGVCLYTGLGAGAGAGFCLVAFDYAMDGGAVDCVKGLASEIANLVGEKDAFLFFQDATITPTDLLDRAIDKSCDTAKEKWGK